MFNSHFSLNLQNQPAARFLMIIKRHLFLIPLIAVYNVRTPRVAIPMNVTGNTIANLLVKYMHDEDSKFGIRVRNVRGDKWVAYGDGRLLQICDKVIRFYTIPFYMQNQTNTSRFYCWSAVQHILKRHCRIL